MDMTTDQPNVMELSLPSSTDSTRPGTPTVTNCERLYDITTDIKKFGIVIETFKQRSGPSTSMESMTTMIPHSWTNPGDSRNTKDSSIWRSSHTVPAVKTPTSPPFPPPPLLLITTTPSQPIRKLLAPAPRTQLLSGTTHYSVMDLSGRFASHVPRNKIQ
ncbi:hypothetical protein TNIN_475061 [Trichonephila inaurata madagascariensis]|uniref:Uncharacterized protein n=1 Tax=Trichonephila inaurata madagascariensis TaxID=2747483 RepID=A0A8X6X461_9ARAC|nr:hypothetical protein TNIN_475061 [Trichonephila inaurata madagascariensis]